MKPLLLIFMLLLPHSEYLFVVELMIKREVYGQEEAHNRSKSEWKKIDDELYKIVEVDSFPSGDYLVINELGIREYIIVEGEIRYMGTSIVDTVGAEKTWTKTELYFSDKGKGVKDERVIEVLGLPLTTEDTIRMNKFDNEPVRTEYRKNYQKTFASEHSWLTDGVAEVDQPRLEAD